MKMSGSQSPEDSHDEGRGSASGLELLDELAGLHAALAAAGTDEEILSAVARHKERWRALASSEDVLAQIRAAPSVRAEEALRDAQRQRLLLETILDNMSIGVVLADGKTGNVLRMNRRVISLLQFDTPQSGAVDSFARPSFVTGTDTEIPSEEWPLARAIKTGARVEDEHDVLLPDGTRVTLNIVATPVLDERGKISKCLVLFTDVSGRRHAEQDRILLQEELIRTQAAALAERSSPLIPISKDIVVMPLIGTIDVSRGQEIMAALLEGASRARARFAILDITGARAVDASAASALMGAAKALRLLGIEPVMTGVHPDVAQTLVSLTVDLSDVVTQGTLESGIAYANQRLRGASSRA